MKPRTFIRIEPVDGGFDYWARIYGHNVEGGWAGSAEVLAQRISRLLREELPRRIAEAHVGVAPHGGKRERRKP